MKADLSPSVHILTFTQVQATTKLSIRDYIYVNSPYVYQMASALVWELEEREREREGRGEIERERSFQCFLALAGGKFGGRRDNKGTIF